MRSSHNLLQVCNIVLQAETGWKHDHPTFTALIHQTRFIMNMLVLFLCMTLLTPGLGLTQKPDHP
jgi:hypothetical protein